jgi:nitrite reductase/ring-hydroxylating ferredoxin subunit
LTLDLCPEDRVLSRRLPSPTIPRGWFQIGWSHDFPPGEAHPLRYFGCDLVVYRGESGVLRVLDAYCRHLGAHLGYGSRVERDCIRCPYHGWLYDREGRTVETPGAEPPLRARIGTWTTAEVDGLVFVLHDPAGALEEAPAPGGFVRSEEPFWPIECTTAVWRNQPMVPQFAADNVVDAGHFTYVHGSYKPAHLVNYEHDRHRFTALYELEFGAGAPSTWATPSGPISGTIQTEAWGIGVMWNRLGGCDDIRSVLGVTPISPTVADLRLTVWVPRTRTDGAPLDDHIRDRWLEQQRSQVDADLLIWANQTFVERPPYIGGESSPMRVFRKYAAGFYAG